MFKTCKRTLVATLAVTAAAAPSAASARIMIASPDSGPAVASVTHQAQVSQPSSGGFAWADAGIGAAATVAVMGAGGLTLSGRRRRGHIARAS